MLNRGAPLISPPFALRIGFWPAICKAGSVKRVIGLVVAVLALAGCGGSATKTVTATKTTNAATAAGSAAASPVASAPSWQPGTPEPDLTDPQIAQAGHGLNSSTAFIGSEDEVLGSLGSGASVNAASNTINAGAERFGRCIAEQIGIHDASHEIALLIAYNRRDSGALQAIGKATGTCVGLKVTHAASYEQSLKSNP